MNIHTPEGVNDVTPEFLVAHGSNTSDVCGPAF